MLARQLCPHPPLLFSGWCSRGDSAAAVCITIPVTAVWALLTRSLCGGWWWWAGGAGGVINTTTAIVTVGPDVTVAVATVAAVAAVVQALVTLCLHPWY